MRYQHSFEVRYGDCDRHERATPHALYGYLQETAIHHSDSVGLSGRQLLELGYGWVLNRVIIEVGHYPIRNDRLTVETWGSNFKGLYAMREWRARDAGHRDLLRATSRWFLMEMDQRKPVRVPPLVPERYGQFPDRALDSSFPRTRPIDAGAHGRPFHVRYSDLDTNQHANSACYVDWLVESAPLEVLEHKTLRTIDLSFKLECTLGDDLVSSSRETTVEGEPRSFDHVIRRQPDAAVLAYGSTVWE